MKLKQWLSATFQISNHSLATLLVAAFVLGMAYYALLLQIAEKLK